MYINVGMQVLLICMFLGFSFCGSAITLLYNVII
uniref:Uncharacterized protein n=1 Tax=Arundo donax TaxID=35708 RepID=A0A0A9B948_ARUDO